MTTKASIMRRWTGPVLRDRKGEPLSARLWLQRREHVWVMHWFAPGPNGKVARPQKSFGRREDAEAFRDKLQTRFNEDPHTRRASHPMTLRQFTDEYVRLKRGRRDRKLKPSSVTAAKAALNLLAGCIGGDTPIAKIGPQHVTRFLVWIDAQPMSVSSRNKHKRQVKAAFNVAVRSRKYLATSPFAEVGMDPVDDGEIRYVTPEEYAGLIGACETAISDGAVLTPLWWRAFVAICYTTALRYAEAVNLTWSDVDFEADAIRVTSKRASEATLEWTPKSHETRSIPAPAETLTILAELHDKAPAGHAYVFIPEPRFAVVKAAIILGAWRDGAEVVNNIRRDFYRIVRAAAEAEPTLAKWETDPETGQRKAVRHTVTIHDFRRTAITNWTRQVNVQTVMMLAGHKNVETTMRYYASVTEDQLELARQAGAAAIASGRRNTGKCENDAKVTHSGRATD